MLNISFNVSQRDLEIKKSFTAELGMIASHLGALSLDNRSEWLGVKVKSLQLTFALIKTE